jgi:predicted DCC family thiol-disulfide oxidoreductase YuxK
MVTAAASTTTGTLLYDADCAFCTRTAAFGPKLRLTALIVPMQSRDLPRLGVQPERAKREVPFVSPTGAVCYGHRAIAAMLRTGPLPMRLAGAALTIWPVSAVARLVYAWVSRHRHSLPGGTAACALPAPPASR